MMNPTYQVCGNSVSILSLGEESVSKDLDMSGNSLKEYVVMDNSNSKNLPHTSIYYLYYIQLPGSTSIKIEVEESNLLFFFFLPYQHVRNNLFYIFISMIYFYISLVFLS